MASLPSGQFSGKPTEREASAPDTRNTDKIRSTSVSQPLSAKSSQNQQRAVVVTEQISPVEREECSSVTTEQILVDDRLAQHAVAASRPHDTQEKPERGTPKMQYGGIPLLLPPEEHFRQASTDQANDFGWTGEDATIVDTLASDFSDAIATAPQPGHTTHWAPAIVPDNDLTDEAYAESTTTSYVTSIASEISKGVLENERLYPNYGQHSYGMPIDEDEMDRMDLQHRKYELVLGGRHFLAPIDPSPQKILEIGTGTGI